jgi:AdoMet-dependent rRNA methyltransferase SPB1
MQLRMVAPLDIGLEQTDAQLGMGQDDVFDLDNVEQDLGRGKDVTRLAEGEMADDDESDGDAQPAAEDEEDTAVDSDEERERKVKGLEDELDGLYDAYRTQMAERDAKFRVKESRKKNALRNEEWGGVKEPGSDDEGSNDESEGEGGWHTIQKHKAAGDVDDDSSGDDEDEDVAKVPTKRRKLVDGKAGLITKLNDKPKLESSKAAQVWFSQDLFAGVPDVDEIEQEEEPEESSEESAEEAEDVEDVAEVFISRALCGKSILTTLCVGRRFIGR